MYGKTKKDIDERLDVLEAFEEHGSMKDLMNKIKRATVRDESLKAKVQVLSEITEHHVKEEESEDRVVRMPRVASFSRKGLE